MTGAQKGRGDMGFVEGRTRFGKGARPTIQFAILAVVLMLPAVSLLAFPAKALASADLSISKQGPSSVEPSEQFDYVLTVSNAEGADTATNVEVKDELPTGVTFEDFEAPAGVSCPAPAPPANTVTCTGLNLEAGDSKTITLKVRAPAAAGVIENRATASVANDPDSPVPSNEVRTTVAPNLVIEKLDDPDPVDTEDILLYTLGIENQGDTDATGVTVRDELPLDKVDFVTVDSADFKCEYKAGIVKCEKGLLKSGDIAKVEIVVEPEKAGTIQNTGAVFVQGVHKPLDTDTQSTVVKDDGGGGGGGGGNGGGGNGGGGNGDEPQPLPPDEDKGPLAGGTARGEDVLVKGDLDCGPNGEDACIDQITIQTENCKLTAQGEELTITLSDQGEPFRLIDGENVDITIRQDGTIVANGRKTLGPLATAFNGGEEDNPTRRILPIPVEQGDTPGGSVNDTFPIISSTGIDGEGCRAVETSDTNQNNPSTNQSDGGGDQSKVIDDTISDKPLPNTGGPSLLGLAVIALGLAVLGGATVVRTGVRRRDR